MKAVILAAGRGTRLIKITKDKPKCLIEISGITILERQISILLKNSIEKIYVVIGYKANDIRKRYGNQEFVELIENKDFETTDNIYSLSLTEKKISGNEFLLLNGDALFEEKIIKNLVNKGDIDLAPIDTKHYDLEELKIRANNNIITEILPKTAEAEISDGSTIGVFKFSSKGSKALFDEIKKSIKEGIKNKWFEYALDKICKNIKMQIIDIHGMKWIEIDEIEDLKKAEELFGR
jgi:choline kinase